MLAFTEQLGRYHLDSTSTSWDMMSISNGELVRDVLLARIASLMLLAVFLGCAEGAEILKSSWHEKCDWKAEDYFDDPQVIVLCKAIEANDLDEIDRLVAAGADVNAQGKGKMTPLLWSFPDNKLERFERLLGHGANPNVIIESDFNSRGAMRAGDSVTHMACKTAFPGYFEAVFAHGGDVNLVKSGKGNLDDTPLFLVIKYGKGNKKQKIQFLLDRGADINYMNGTGATPVMQAVTWGGQYDLAEMLLESGADHGIYRPKSNSRLIHNVLAEERRSATWTPRQKADYENLLQWLVDHGESIEEAKADRERWKSWNTASGEFRRRMDAEIAARKAREAREKKAAERADQHDD